MLSLAVVSHTTWLYAKILLYTSFLSAKKSISVSAYQLKEMSILLSHALLKKKVSYRKQVACQHSCHKNFGHRTGGMVDPVKTFI